MDGARKWLESGPGPGRHIIFPSVSASKIDSQPTGNPMADYKHVIVPKAGEKIRLDAQMKLQVPDRPILPFIEGDGTGADIWKASRHVFDEAVRKVYGGKRKIE